MVLVQQNRIVTAQHAATARDHAYSLLDKLPKDLYYHAKPHTTDVVLPTAVDLAKRAFFSILDDKNNHLIWEAGIAAAFHDVGYVVQYEDNEPLAIDMFRTYVRETPLEYSWGTVERISCAIAATSPNKFGEKPCQLGCILRDADVSPMGRPDHLMWLNLYRGELLQHPEHPLHEDARHEESWYKLQLDWISNYSWQSDVAREQFEDRRLENKTLIEKIAESYGVKI